MSINIFFLARALGIGWKCAFKLQRKKIWEMYFSVKTLSFHAYPELHRMQEVVIPASTFFIINDHG